MLLHFCMFLCTDFGVEEEGPISWRSRPRRTIYTDLLRGLLVEADQVGEDEVEAGLPTELLPDAEDARPPLLLQPLPVLRIGGYLFYFILGVLFARR